MSTDPGATAYMRTPVSASPTESDRTMPMWADLAAAYPTSLGSPRNDAIDVVNSSLPRADLICARNARSSANAPVTLVCRTPSKSATVISVTDFSYCDAGVFIEQGFCAMGIFQPCGEPLSVLSSGHVMHDPACVSAKRVTDRLKLVRVGAAQYKLGAGGQKTGRERWTCLDRRSHRSSERSASQGKTPRKSASP